MPKLKKIKKNSKYNDDELQLLFDSENLIKDLVKQLEIQIKHNKYIPNKYSLPIIPKNVPQIIPGVYNGVGSLKTTCTGCQERLFSPL